MPDIQTIFRQHEARETAIAAERQSETEWIAANGGQAFLDQMTGANQFNGRSVQFLESSVHPGCFGVIARARRQGPVDWIFEIRISSVAWRFGATASASREPGRCVLAGLNEVQFVD